MFVSWMTILEVYMNLPTSNITIVVARNIRIVTCSCFLVFSITILFFFLPHGIGSPLPATSRGGFECFLSMEKFTIQAIVLVFDGSTEHVSVSMKFENFKNECIDLNISNCLYHTCDPHSELPSCIRMTIAFFWILFLNSFLLIQLLYQKE